MCHHHPCTISRARRFGTSIFHPTNSFSLQVTGNPAKNSFAEIFWCFMKSIPPSTRAHCIHPPHCYNAICTRWESRTGLGMLETTLLTFSTNLPVWQELWLQDGNVCTSQPDVSREQRRLCTGSAQGRLSFGSGVLRFAHPTYTLTRNHQLLTRGPKRPLFP